MAMVETDDDDVCSFYGAVVSSGGPGTPIKVKKGRVLLLKQALLESNLAAEHASAVASRKLELTRLVTPPLLHLFCCSVHSLYIWRAHVSVFRCLALPGPYFCL